MRRAHTPPTLHTPPTTTQRLWRWFVRHLPAIIIVAAAAAISLAFIAAIHSIAFNAAPVTFVAPPKKPAPVFHSALTGEKVPSQAATTAPVTAVMIENSPAARPQSGLKAASVVYEAPAEGGITRFMALYQSDIPQIIGPVRSLRIYYLNWASAYQASIAHVGGSGNALAEVRSGRHRDIDQFFNGGSYWRSSDRRAPHNVYTSADKLRALNAQKGYVASQFQSFMRTDAAPAAPVATSVNIQFSGPLYHTAYRYDATSGTYARSLAGQPHLDREAGQIAPKVIVAIETTTERRIGPDGYDDLVTTGSGKATIFQRGTVTTATWQKDGPTAPLRLLDQAGKDIPLVRGQTWISAIVAGRGSVAWQ